MSPTTLSAIAASIAAVAALAAAGLSGWTAHLAAERDETKWRRDAFLDVVVAFLEASFAGAGDLARQARLRGDDIQPFVERTLEVEMTQVESLTRMRLIAPEQVIQAAVSLRNIEHEIHSGILLADDPMPDRVWLELRAKRNDARVELLSGAREYLGTGHGGDIQPVRMLMESHKLPR